MKCEKCDIPEDEDTKLEFHHLVPKSIGGTDKDGRRYLCKKHHDMIHKMMVKKVFDFVPEERRKACRESLKAFTLWWMDIKR